MNAFMKTEDNVDKIRELREEISWLKEQVRALETSDEKREKAEEAIRTSGEMLCLVIDNIPQRVFWKDIRSVYMGCNKNFARAAGVGDPENITGKTDFDPAWARSEAEAFRQDDREVMDNDRPKYHIIEPQLQADGRQSWLDTNKVPLHDAQGRVIGILGTYEDITERLQLTQFAVDHFTDPSIWLSPEGEILYVNEAACRSLGYSSAELLALHIWDVDPDYQPEKYARMWDDLKQKGFLLFESSHVASDGHRFPVEVSTNYITFREREYLISFNRDIMGQKQAEQQLEEAKSQAELYVDPMSHDIGNMDQAMLGYLEMAIETLRPEGEDKELLTQPLEIIKNSTRLINNVRKLRQLQSGEIPYRKVDPGKGAVGSSGLCLSCPLPGRAHRLPPCLRLHSGCQRPDQGPLLQPDRQRHQVFLRGPPHRHRTDQSPIRERGGIPCGRGGQRPRPLRSAEREAAVGRQRQHRESRAPGHGIVAGEGPAGKIPRHPQYRGPGAGRLPERGPLRCRASCGKMSSVSYSSILLYRF
jgi:PAS domain S-box-containing protein